LDLIARAQTIEVLLLMYFNAETVLYDCTKYVVYDSVYNVAHQIASRYVDFLLKNGQRYTVHEA